MFDLNDLGCKIEFEAWKERLIMNSQLECSPCDPWALIS